MQENKHISTYRQSLKEQIVTTAMSQFVKFGIKAVRMDDIASMLGISKRTLYEIYENKEVLLFEGVRRYHESTWADIRNYAFQADNVIDIALYVCRVKNRECQMTSPLFYEDIQKYPNVIKYLNDEHLKNQAQQQAFMERGVAEGYFRSDINFKLINLMFEAMGSYIRDHRLIQQFSSDELFNNILFVTLRGICTEKGLAKMQENDSFL